MAHALQNGSTSTAIAPRSLDHHRSNAEVAKARDRGLTVSRRSTVERFAAFPMSLSRWRCMRRSSSFVPSGLNLLSQN